MQRRPWRQLVASFIGVCFAIASIGPVSSDHCFMRGVDGTMSMADGSSMSSDAMSPMPNMGQTAATSAASGHHNASTPDRDGSAPHDSHGSGQCCTYCGSAPVGADVGRLPTLLALPVRIVAQLPVWATDVVRPSSVDVVLPYPNGPPSSRHV